MVSSISATFPVVPDYIKDDPCMTEHWRTALGAYWGISADLSRLDGEYDLNFMVSGAPGHVLKVMRAGCPTGFVDLQCQAIEHALARDPDLPLPPVVRTPSGESAVMTADEGGAQRIMWLLGRLPGQAYAHVRPHTPELLRDLGAMLGRLDSALQGFSHPVLSRDFKWNLMQADWIEAQLDIVEEPARWALLSDIVRDYKRILPALQALPMQAVHNDVNDYNVLVHAPLSGPARVSGLVDFGDMCAAPRICELAIAAAYAVLDHPDPEMVLAQLVAGYHAHYPLSGAELDLLWPLLRMRLAVSVVNSALMALENPDDPYVVISQAPAWRFLEGGAVDAGLIRQRLRAACGLPVTDEAEALGAWLDRKRGEFAPVLGADLSDLPVRALSVEAVAVPRDPFSMQADEVVKLGGWDGAWFLGYYREPRLIYTDVAFRRGRWKNANRRTVHLAVDVFAAVGSPVCAPLAATVEYVRNCEDYLDYGGMVILRHETDTGLRFYTLYGHLDPLSFGDLAPGQELAAGAQFATLGDVLVNGGWAPHLHFQLALSVQGMDGDWPGVADPDELYLWEAICPNPAALLNLPDEKLRYQPAEQAQVAQARARLFAPNLRLSYDEPVMLVRGWKHHLFDVWGRPYLDAYNNVPHVGHAHPRIQAVAADQLTRLNSNTRYLHPAQVEFAEKLRSKLPDPLSVCFFVNSGTEANELALRLARAHTGGRDMVTPDHGYHGNTTGAIDISAYKFNAPGGVGRPDWVQLIDVADDYRGRFRRDDPERGAKYAALVDPALDAIAARGGRLAGFIAETYPSVGGQILPPPGYLSGVYARVRAAGGVCIADEVQTGLGRLGSHYFAFEEQGVVPDVVVLGKPIGNGHPLGVVITTPEIAQSFARGPEFFSTFGGSILSCRVGKEVLDIVDEEGLMANAATQGDALIEGLQALQARYPVIGDVRGRGLFIGVDLVHDCDMRTPATEVVARLKNRLRARRVLVGTEGPKDNILKVRPPICIDAEGVACFLDHFQQVLEEIPK